MRPLAQATEGSVRVASRELETRVTADEAMLLSQSPRTDAVEVVSPLGAFRSALVPRPQVYAV